MLDEPYKIVAMSDLAKYQRNARMGKAAMIIALVTVVASSFVVGRLEGRAEVYEETRDTLETMQADNVETVKTFVMAWENQQEGFRLIESWAQYIRGRQESIDLNRGVSPISRPKWPKRKSVDPWNKP